MLSFIFCEYVVFLSGSESVLFCLLFAYICITVGVSSYKEQGRIQEIQVRGGEHLKKLRRAEGGAKIVGVFRVKKSRLYAKKIIFFSYF